MDRTPEDDKEQKKMIRNAILFAAAVEAVGILIFILYKIVK